MTHAPPGRQHRRRNPRQPLRHPARHRPAQRQPRDQSREAALVEPPKPPPLLADALRARSVFALPDEDEDEAVPGPNRSRHDSRCWKTRSWQPRSVPAARAAPMRETLEGWEQWRRTRYGFVAAPRLDLAAWRALSPRRRMLDDLHRAAIHANLPLLQTRMTTPVTITPAWARPSPNRRPHARIPLRAHQRSRRPAGTTDRGRLSGSHRLRGRMPDRAASRRYRHHAHRRPQPRCRSRGDS